MAHWAGKSTELQTDDPDIQGDPIGRNSISCRLVPLLQGTCHYCPEGIREGCLGRSGPACPGCCRSPPGLHSAQHTCCSKSRGRINGRPHLQLGPHHHQPHHGHFPPPLRRAKPLPRQGELPSNPPRRLLYTSSSRKTLHPNVNVKTQVIVTWQRVTLAERGSTRHSRDRAARQGPPNITDAMMYAVLRWDLSDLSWCLWLSLSVGTGGPAFLVTVTGGQQAWLPARGTRDVPGTPGPCPTS